MFEPVQGDGGRVMFTGRLDAAQSAKAQSFLDALADPGEIDLSGLEYISSAGLGVLLRTHKRLMGSGGRLRLVNVSHHIFDILRYSGFDQLFDVQRPD
jgi:anti-sigma B factor antagonist